MKAGLWELIGSALGVLAFCAIVSCSSNDRGTNDRSPSQAVEPPNGPPGMVWIPGGKFTMGAIKGDQQARPDESPAHLVEVSGFWMDITEVTNDDFEEFVKTTGYITTAEVKPEWEEIKKQLPPNTPKPPDSLFVAASMVFTPTQTDNLEDWLQWWKWVEGSNWRNPQGPSSNIEEKGDHPVVQVSWDDANAYLRWKGKRLPTEAEWEFAARGGVEGGLYPWGNDLNIALCGNTWQGTFPEHNTEEDGFFATAPVKSFKSNGFGLYDMAGNVWEWTADWYNTRYYGQCAQIGTVTNPPGASRPYDPFQPYLPQRVQRGGSFLCHESYCSSYRASARMHSSPDSSQDHVGFRGVITPEMWQALQTPEAY